MLLTSTNTFSADINDAVTDWTQGDNDQIVKEMVSAQTKQYWRVLVSAMDVVRCSEMYMSLGYEFSIKIDPLPTLGDIPNIEKVPSVGGMNRTIKQGEKKRFRSYGLKLTSAQLTQWQTVVSYLNDYSKDFFIKDHKDEVWLANFTQVPQEVHYGENIITEMVLNLEEQL